ncbi:MAG: tRNA pseudouridine(55) synthase TruB [Actinobacteria bacterium HGW-Actinobacteria-4]|nr:MAG: tRNA pseudouridine(55) synthase TruB [Actinobacteria bacterium HGW-Actinobacteria-4]
MTSPKQPGSRQPRPEPTPGIVVVDKPAGWTSHDVVSRMRRLAQTKKVGHAGTLDPMATGVLIIGIGKATKLLTYIVGHGKTYEATVRLGQSTITDDAEGECVETVDASAVTDSQIADAVAGLTGSVLQVPSSVSAIKVDGQRAYKRVREGEDVVLAARPVTVSAFDVLAVRREGSLVDLDISVTVSSGTYVRALARDLGSALGVGGHLTALRRTAVGDIGVGRSTPLEELERVVDGGGPLPLIPLAEAAQAVMPARAVTEDEARALGFGQSIEGAGAEVLPGEHPVCVAIDPHGDAVAILQLKAGKLTPAVVFAPAVPGAQAQ